MIAIFVALYVLGASATVMLIASSRDAGPWSAREFMSAVAVAFIWPAFICVCLAGMAILRIADWMRGI